MNRRVVFHRVSGIPARQSARRVAVAVAVLSFVITSLQSAVALAQGPPAPPSRFHIVGEEPPPISSGPSTPREIPGTIEAELFDSGANGSAYWDSSSGNSGHQYRATDVDIEGCTEGGYNVGWTTSGEWLGYTVSVAAAGTYNFDFRVASVGGGTLHVEFNGEDKTGGVGVPSTGGWQTWTTVRKTVTLNAGTQSMRVVFDTGNVNLHLSASGWRRAPTRRHRLLRRPVEAAGCASPPGTLTSVVGISPRRRTKLPTAARMSCCCRRRRRSKNTCRRHMPTGSGS